MMLRGLFDKNRGGRPVEIPGLEVLAPIREGSMARIFKARELETGRIVAVKVQKEEARKAIEKLEGRYRDFNEGQITASFDHPNIIKCYGHGEVDSNAYLVMEYLDGMALSTLIQTGSKCLDGHRIAFMQLSAAALSHVHAKRFIHHDFCPKNLFITREGRVKLIDFGLATPLLNNPTVISRMGTVEVLAPEMLRREHSDHRVDIFAWGVVAYEVLCGHWPFESPEQHQTLNKILNVNPVPLIRRMSNLPEEIGTFVMRCIEKDPTKRPPALSPAVAIFQRHRTAGI